MLKALLKTDEFKKFCEEVAQNCGRRYETIVFRDGTYTKVSGPWQANKPVWAVFQGYYSPEEIEEALREAWEPW